MILFSVAQNIAHFRESRTPRTYMQGLFATPHILIVKVQVHRRSREAAKFKVIKLSKILD